MPRRKTFNWQTLSEPRSRPDIQDIVAKLTLEFFFSSPNSTDWRVVISSHHDMLRVFWTRSQYKGTKDNNLTKLLTSAGFSKSIWWKTYQNNSSTQRKLGVWCNWILREGSKVKVKRRARCQNEQNYTEMRLQGTQKSWFFKLLLQTRTGRQLFGPRLKSKIR